MLLAFTIEIVQLLAWRLTRLDKHSVTANANVTSLAVYHLSYLYSKHTGTWHDVIYDTSIPASLTHLLNSAVQHNNKFDDCQRTKGEGGTLARRVCPGAAVCTSGGRLSQCGCDHGSPAAAHPGRPLAAAGR